MNEPDLQALERRLHTLPPLLDVPPSLVAPSVQAAVADPDSPAPHPASATPLTRMVTALVARGGRRDRRRCGRRGDHHASHPSPAATAGFQRIATLTGAGNASGYVDVGRADGAVEPVVVSISHLDPSPGDQYYEIWFQTGGKNVPGVAFNAGSDGRAEVHLSAPTNTKWVRCWITRQSIDDPGSRTIVMRANPALRST